MPFWEYNNKLYLEIRAVKVEEAKVDNGFNKNHPCIMDLTCSRYDFQMNREQITCYSIFEIKLICFKY